MLLSNTSGLFTNEVEYILGIFAQINNPGVCSCNQDKNLTKDTDSMTIGIELCNIPQISEHCAF
jgi:hypothetical protein